MKSTNIFLNQQCMAQCILPVYYKQTCWIKTVNSQFISKTQTCQWPKNPEGKTLYDKSTQ